LDLISKLEKKNMKLNSLQELYLEQLKDLYDGEQQITKALPKMIDKATSNDLKAALTEHLEVTKKQVTRLEQIFNSLGEEAKGEKCKGLRGILDEGDDLVGDIKDPDVRDAGIIASAQRVEHYEMAGYGTARTYAKLLNQENASQLLQQTLDEEKDADQTLTTLARQINVSAKSNKSVEDDKPLTKRTRVA
jgi:ferritin-like metal-binding protein YciE